MTAERPTLAITPALLHADAREAVAAPLKPIAVGRWLPEGARS